MPRRCVVPGCSSEGRLHSFPHPTLQKERFESWLRAIFGNSQVSVCKNEKICSIHFEEKYIRLFSKYLFANAVPTLCLPKIEYGPSTSREVLPTFSDTVSLPAARSSEAIRNDHTYASTMPANMEDGDSDDPDDPEPKRTLVPAADTGPGQTAEAVDCNFVKMLITSDISKRQYFSVQETKSRVPKTGLNDIFQSAINKAISTIKQYEEQQETSGNHVSSDEHPIFLEFHDQDDIISEQMEHEKQQEIEEEKTVSNIEPIAFKFPNTDEYYMHDPMDEREEQDSNIPTFFKVEMLDSPSVSEDSCDDMEDQEIDEQEIEEQELEEGEIDDIDEEIHNFAGLVISELKSLKSKKSVHYVIERMTNILVKAHLGEYDGVRPSNGSRIDGTEYA